MHLHIMFIRTWGHLKYAKRDVNRHFETLRNRYHDASHRNGQLWIEDSLVLRRQTDDVLRSEKCKNQFRSFLELPSDECDHVYTSYVYRVESMMGNEVVRQATESLKRKGEGTLESLRSIKQKKNNHVKLTS